MTKILVLRNKRVFKVFFIHLIGCELDQDLGPPFSHVFKQLVIGPPTLKKCLMNKILVLRNKRVFKGLFIHLIGCEHDQDLGPTFSHVFKQVRHWSTYLEKKPIFGRVVLAAETVSITSKVLEKCFFGKCICL